MPDRGPWWNRCSCRMDYDSEFWPCRRRMAPHLLLSCLSTPSWRASASTGCWGDQAPSLGSSAFAPLAPRRTAPLHRLIQVAGSQGSVLWPSGCKACWEVRCMARFESTQLSLHAPLEAFAASEGRKLHFEGRHLRVSWYTSAYSRLRLRPERTCCCIRSWRRAGRRYRELFRWSHLLCSPSWFHSTHSTAWSSPFSRWPDRSPSILLSAACTSSARKDKFRHSQRVASLCRA